MTDQDHLRDLLRQAGTLDPHLGAPDRAAAVVRRGQAARRRALVAGAAIAVTAIGVPIAVTQLASEPARVPVAQEPTAAAPPAEPAECPREQQGLRTLRPEPDTFDGAFADFEPVSSAVCYGVDPMGAPEYAGRAGELDENGIADVLESVSASTSPTSTFEGGCIDSGPTRLIVLVDSESRRVTLTDSDCTGEFAFTEGYWTAPREVEKLITEALSGKLTQG